MKKRSMYVWCPVKPDGSVMTGLLSYTRLAAWRRLMDTLGGHHEPIGSAQSSGFMVKRFRIVRREGES